MNTQGFFQIAGVPPADYRLVARHVNGSAGMAAIAVRGDEEASLARPLLLSEPVGLDIRLNPPLDPRGEPWMLRLTSVDTVPALTRLQATAGGDGRMRAHPLAPGEYSLQVESAGQRWFSQLVSVGPDPGPVQIELSVIRVRGEVTQAGRPLEATVGLRDSAWNMTASFTSAADGSFEGYLPAAGPWHVEVVNEEKRIRSSLSGVRVTTDGPGQEGRLHIALADTVIAGRVVGEEGAPAGGALVTVLAPGRLSVQTTAEGDGSFEVRGLPTLAVHVRAEAWGGLATDPVEVDLSGGTADVVLVLRRQEELAVRVLAAESGQPIPGATVWVRSAHLRVAGFSLAQSDAGGGFTILVPPRTGAAEVFVSAPPRPAKMARLGAATHGRPAVIELDRQGGTLVIEYAPTAGEGKETIALFHASTAELAEQLYELWARRLGGHREPGRNVLPGLSAGSYSACLTTLAAFNARLAPATERCATGVLVAGGELRLRVP